MNTKRFINFRYIFYPFLAFLFGIIVARGLYQGKVEILVITILLLLSLGTFLILRKRYKILIILFCLFFIGNGFYYIGEARYYNKDYTGQVLVVGRVSDDFEESDYYYQVLLKDASINGEKTRNIKVSFSKNGLQLKVGDIVSFESEVEAVKLFSLNSFNSTYYRSNTGYTTDTVNLKNVVISEGHINLDEKIRLSVKEKLYDNLSEENASVAYAVLFGDKSGISYEVKESYRNSGIIHILTVSGLHVSFLVALIWGLLKLLRVNKYANFAITTTIIIFYSALCGFTPSVLRAGIMGIILMLAGLLQKRYDSLNAMGVAGFIILLVNPLSAFDVGFLMSMACVCGIILLYPLFNNLFKNFMPKFVRQYIAVSLSAQITILPFLALFSSYINLLSFIVNLFVVPLFSIIYPWLFFSAILSVIMPFMSFLLVPVGWGFSAIYYIAYIFSYTILQVPLKPFYFSVMVFFFLLVYLCSQFFMCKPINKFMCASAIIFCLSCSFGFTSIGSNMKTGLVYLNYYNKEAIILKNSNGQTMLIGDNYLVSRYMDNFNLNNIDIYLSFDNISSFNTFDLNEYKIKHFLSTNGEITDNFVICNPNTNITVGDYDIVFVENDNKVIGANISFDGYQIFVANSEILNYNDIALFDNDYFNPDIFIVAEDYYLAENYNGISISTVKNDITSFNFLDYGNFSLTFNNESFVFRGLD